MSSITVSYLKNLGKSVLDDSELYEFIKYAETEKTKNDKRESIEYLLRVIRPDLEQTKLLIESELVKYSIDLQYTLKKYISSKQYREAEDKSENESDWLLLLSSIGGMPPVC